MEATWRWMLVTAIAPVAWGSNYYVTREFLPPGHPLWGAAIRALPAGLLLLLVCRVLPHGSWWWRSLVLGVLNTSAFFALVYVAAQLLPTSVASVIMATSSVAMMVIARILLPERPGRLPLVGAGLGVAGVCAMLLTGAEAVSGPGVAASVAAMLMSSVGYVLTKKWGRGIPVLAGASWQLVAGGLVLLPVAVLVEGRPPALDAAAVAGFAYVGVVATAVAFAAWFTGLRRLSAGTVGLVGLLNPVTGVLLGTALAGELLGGRQAAGIGLVLLGILLGHPAAARVVEHLRRTLPHRGPQGAVLDQAPSPQRHEGGTPNVPCAAGLAQTCRTLDPVLDEVAPAHERALLVRMLDGLATVPGVRTLRTFDDSTDRVGVVAFTVDHHPAGRVAAHLSAEHGIGVRDGKFCAHPLVDRLTEGAPDGAVRASIGVGTTAEDVDRLVDALRGLTKRGARWDYAVVDGRWTPTPDPRDLDPLRLAP